MFRRKILTLLLSLLLVVGVCALPDKFTIHAIENLEPAIEGSGANLGLADEDLAIIVNVANPTDSFSFAQLRSIFLAERGHWPNGQKITVAMREQGHPERVLVLRTICRMSESDFTQYLMHSSFKGQVQAGPKLLASPTGVRKFVFNVPGAIGYVRSGELDGSVKAVRIEGRLPGEAGYRLKLAAR